MIKSKLIISASVITLMLCMTSCGGTKKESREILSDDIEDKVTISVDSSKVDELDEVEEVKEEKEEIVAEAEVEEDSPSTVPESYYIPYGEKGTTLDSTIEFDQNKEGLIINPIGLLITQGEVEEKLDGAVGDYLKDKELVKVIDDFYSWSYLENKNVSFHKEREIMYTDKNKESDYPFFDTDVSMYMSWYYPLSEDMSAIALTLTGDQFDSVMTEKDMAKEVLTSTIKDEYLEYLLEGKGEVEDKTDEVVNTISVNIPSNKWDGLNFTRYASYPVAPDERGLYPSLDLSLDFGYSRLQYVKPKATVPHYEAILKESNSRFDLSTLMNGSFINDAKKYKQFFAEMASDYVKPETVYTSNTNYNNVLGQITDSEEFVYEVQGYINNEIQYGSTLRTAMRRSSTAGGETSFCIDGKYLVGAFDNKEDAMKEAIKVYTKLMNNLLPDANFTEAELINRIKEGADYINTTIDQDLSFLGITCHYNGNISVQSSNVDGTYSVSFSIGPNGCKY